ncbi:hypothetical protein Mgra_00000525 [Meloidogyne graminicola]|uniref:Uncharacterized protein n=1 Tax=Meloidogyne graminicola TaxID=189291 RepID=A0A8T0A1W4_9BILA|nr:hypothetical protein Mgra_00000525 [Meloidogyne graminicola]
MIKFLKEFSSKFIATISSASEDYSSGGSKRGWLFPEAIKQFDKDWSNNFSYYTEKLGCQEPLELVQKLGSSVRIFLDGCNGWRVATVKTFKNSILLNQVDMEIEQKNRVRRRPVFIEPNDKRGRGSFSLSDGQNSKFIRDGNNNLFVQSSKSSFSRKVNFQKHVRYVVAPNIDCEEISVLCERMARLAITNDLLALYDDNSIEN